MIAQSSECSREHASRLRLLFRSSWLSGGGGRTVVVRGVSGARSPVCLEQMAEPTSN